MTASIEVAGLDMGAVPSGLDDNFALGTLTLGGADVGNVKLVDSTDNQPSWSGREALYVSDLVLGSGSSLDLNGINLYYGSLVDNGGTVTLNGGSLTQISEPATLWVLALSGWLLRRRNVGRA
ncbi:MAG: hypothetical protein ACE15C_21895 [Phycisphaerae bacterium]